MNNNNTQSSESPSSPLTSPSKLPSQLQLQLNPITHQTTSSLPKHLPPITGFCYDPTMQLHHPLPGGGDQTHPEIPQRLSQTFNFAVEKGLVKRMHQLSVREILKEEVMLIHSELHWERLQAIQDFSLPSLQSRQHFFERMSLYANPQTPLCSRLSAGGVLECAKAVAEGRLRNSFAVVRPPGHHAEPLEPMGFCYLNNVAIASKWIQTCYGDLFRKVLILDWDVHHGNGTQKSFFQDPNVLYISIHRHENGEFYPGGPEGGANMVGEGDGVGRNVNIPWSKSGMGDGDYLYAFQHIVMPIAYEFNPDFVFISAGYDAAEGDPLGENKVSPAGFAQMTHMLSVLANGKLVMALEGGYNVQACAESATACMSILLGDAPPRTESLVASLNAAKDVQEVALYQSKYWKSVVPKVEEKDEYPDEFVTSVSEILKQYRCHELYHKFDMCNILLKENSKFKHAFNNQIFATDDLYYADTIVVFMHEYGNLRAEISSMNCDVNLEKTYLIDSSSEIIKWAREHEYGLLDVNIVARPVAFKDQHLISRSDEGALEAKLAKYVWDNVLSLCRATKIVMIGHSAGALALMDVLNNRAVTQKVRATIFVMGYEAPPQLKPYSELKEWYKSKSLVLLPQKHKLLDERYQAGKLHRKYGNVFEAPEIKPLRIMHTCWNVITEFIKTQLSPIPSPEQFEPPEPKGKGKAVVIDDPNPMYS